MMKLHKFGLHTNLPSIHHKKAESRIAASTRVDCSSAGYTRPVAADRPAAGPVVADKPVVVGPVAVDRLVVVGPVAWHRFAGPAAVDRLVVVGPGV